LGQLVLHAHLGPISQLPMHDKKARLWPLAGLPRLRNQFR
jgi:hypothetical protein